jgi:RNA-directed DNA polymerase
MFGSSLKSAVLDPTNVANAWRRVKNDNTRWSAQISARQLDSNVLLYTTELIQQLRRQQYQAAGFRRIQTTKADGSKRILSAYYRKDKMAQRMVNQVVQATLEKHWHPCSYGYRIQRNRFQAADKANQFIKSGLCFVLDADLRQFFDSIPHGKLKKQMRKVISCRWTLALLNDWIDEGYFPAFSMLGKKGIPQGAIVSPMLCNLYLNQFDQKLSKAGIPFVRYADDFLLFAHSRKQIEHGTKYCKRLLAELGLELNQQKTNVVNANKGIRFLGIDLER